MGIFNTWLHKEGLADSTTAFKMDHDDRGVDFEKTRNEIFKLVFEKYPERTMEFLNSIAQTGDSEIANLLKKIDSERPVHALKPEHPVSGEVIPPVADTGSSEMPT